MPVFHVNAIRYGDFFMMGHQALISERGGGSDQSKHLMTLVNLGEMRLVYGLEPGFDRRNISLRGAICRGLPDTAC